MRKSTKILSTLASLLFLVSILLGIIFTCSFNHSFYQYEYNKSHQAEVIGMSDEDLMKATDTLLDYLENKRDDIKYISAPISEIALKLGSPKFTNMVALGVLGSAEPNLKIDLYGKALKLVLTGKKESMIEVNLNAIKEAEKSILAGNFT